MIPSMTTLSITVLISKVSMMTLSIQAPAVVVLGVVVYIVILIKNVRTIQIYFWYKQAPVMMSLTTNNRLG